MWISQLWDGELSYGSITVLQLDVFDDVPSEIPLVHLSAVYLYSLYHQLH